MHDYGFSEARIHTLKLHKRYADAAKAALGERNIFDCVRLLLCTNDPELIRQAVRHVLHGLWTILPYGATNTQISNPYIVSLLQWISKIGTSVLTDAELRQVWVKIYGTRFRCSADGFRSKPSERFTPTTWSV